MDYKVKGNKDELVQRFMSEYVDAFFVANDLLHNTDASEDYDEMDPDTFMAICCEIMDGDPDALAMAQEEGSPFNMFYNSVKDDIIDPDVFENIIDDVDGETDEKVETKAYELIQNYPDAFAAANRIYLAYEEDGYFERINCTQESFLATCLMIIEGDEEALKTVTVRYSPFREFYMEGLVGGWIKEQ